MTRRNWSEIVLRVQSVKGVEEEGRISHDAASPKVPSLLTLLSRAPLPAWLFALLSRQSPGL
jgi:hypothetical protein